MSPCSRSLRGWLRKSPATAATSPNSCPRPSQPTSKPSLQASDARQAALRGSAPLGREYRMSKSLIALPFVALALIAAKPAQQPATAAPQATLIAPPEVAADPANRFNIQLSSGGTVVIQLRPDLAPNHVRRIQTLTSTGFYNG